MDVTLKSKYNVGDAVRSHPASEYPFDGKVEDIKFDLSWGGFRYLIREPDGTATGYIDEWQVYPKFIQADVDRVKDYLCQTLTDKELELDEVVQLITHEWLTHVHDAAADAYAEGMSEAQEKADDHN